MPCFRNSHVGLFNGRHSHRSFSQTADLYRSNLQFHRRKRRRPSPCLLEQGSSLLGHLRRPPHKKQCTEDVWCAVFDIICSESPSLLHLENYRAGGVTEMKVESPQVEPEGEPEPQLAVIQRAADFSVNDGLKRTTSISELTPKKLKQCATREIGTQCNLDDMLEPMAVSALHRRMCVRRVQELPLESDIMASSIVDLHFSSSRDLAEVSDWAARLSEQQLQDLAHGFLGSRIAGIAVKSGPKARLRLVGDRFVSEANMLSQRLPKFRSALTSSCMTLFFGGFPERPFNGRGLFALVDHDAQAWSPVIHTALNFASRLICDGALPQSLAAELLQRSFGCALLDAKHMMSLVKLDRNLVFRSPHALFKCNTLHFWGPSDSRSAATCKILGKAETTSCNLVRFAAQHARKSPAPPLAQSQSSSCLAMQSKPEPCLARADTAPPALCPKKRSVGTILRLQDDMAPHCCVSFAGATTCKPFVLAEAIPLEIPDDDLPDYWRSVAGGEHKPAKLEERAKMAEAMLYCNDN